MKPIVHSDELDPEYQEHLRLLGHFKILMAWCSLNNSPLDSQSLLLVLFIRALSMVLE